MTTSQALLVHGAWGGTHDWKLVQERLEAADVTSTAIVLPSREPAESTFDDDVSRVREAIESFDDAAVLVGHSYAGMVITAAAAHTPEVRALVYVCALLPQRGDSAASLMQADPQPSEVFGALVHGQNGTTTLDPLGAKQILFNDVDDEKAAPYIAALGPQRMATFEAAVADLGWQGRPTTYVLTTRDLVLSPSLQRQMSASADTVVELDAGHFPMLSRPGDVAAAIEVAVRATR